MRDHRADLIRWVADVEDDVGDPTRLHVFVPSVMGAGILVSLGILVSDALRHLRGGAGQARRRRRIQRRARALAGPAVLAIGAELPPPLPVRRELRTRDAYLATGVAAVAVALYVSIGQTFNYIREDGYLEGVHWVEALALTTSAALLAAGIVALAVGLRYPRVPRWARAAIDHTPLGRWNPDVQA